MHRRWVIFLVALVCVFATGCTGDDDDAAPASTTPAKGCTRDDGSTVPPGAASARLGDLDGDGRGDEMYVSVLDGGNRVFGVRTAAGGRSQWSTPDASPIAPSVYGVADANEDGRAELFVNPGRIVDVLAMFDCRLLPYLNAQGEPYAFDLGFAGTGTGVGCVDADGDGRRDLVGLLASRDPASGDQRVPWTRTIVELHGRQARNGSSQHGTFERPRDDTAIGLLSSVTCGDDSFSSPLRAPSG